MVVMSRPLARAALLQYQLLPVVDEKNTWSYKGCDMCSPKAILPTNLRRAQRPFVLTLHQKEEERIMGMAGYSDGITSAAEKDQGHRVYIGTLNYKYDKHCAAIVPFESEACTRDLGTC